MKLKSKINIYSTVTFTILLVIIHTTIYFVFQEMMYQKELEHSHQNTINTVAGMKNVHEQIEQDDLLRAYLPLNGMIRIVQSEGQINSTITDPNHQSLKDYPSDTYQKEVMKLVKVQGIQHTFVSIPIIMEDGTVANLQMMENLEDVTKVLNMLKLILVFATLVATIPVLLSAQIVSNIISKPILSMINTMTEIQKSGKHKQIPLPKKSKDELYQMGMTFNGMIEQLEKNYEKQEEFVMNASHELKTPLTIIESYSDLLKRRGYEQPELFEESIEAIHSEAVRMRELTEQLLYLATNDAKWKFYFESVEVLPLAKEIIQHFYSAFNCQIALHVNETIAVFADRQRLKQLLFIFVENAYKYSGGRITIVIDKLDEQYGIIEVNDTGIGIPKENLDEIFERFYRIDQARNRKAGGSGLGLAIAKEITDNMDAKVKIDSEEDKGTSAKVIISLANTH
ncbi:MAG TPA: HAMP domain-containing sensor histidine kinase [Candidatus Dormibacteraeota bacterium]|nr:HAMP domain-containing sensor histidine kinase [Candidatus Dormibacteraeota bacterium]